MSVKEITSRQIFGMKRESVEKRIEEYFEETKDACNCASICVCFIITQCVDGN